MFLHVVLMEIEANTAFHAEVERWCDRIRRECDGVLGYAYRENVAPRAAGLGRAVVAHFVDAAAHDAYQESPAHQGMKAFMATEIRRIAVFDNDVPDLAPTRGDDMERGVIGGAFTHCAADPEPRP